MHLITFLVCQLIALPDSSMLSARLAPFIPKDHRVLHITKGDLNQDRLEDVILVTSNDHLTVTEPDSTSPVRSVLILIRDKAELRLAAQNNNAVLCRECGGAFGDPFAGMAIHEDGFSIYHYGGAGWRWSIDSRFKWSGTIKQWYLVQTVRSGHHIYNDEIMDKEEIIVPDSLVTFERFTIDP